VNIAQSNGRTLSAGGYVNYVEELGVVGIPGGAPVEFTIPAKTMLTVTLRLETALSAAMAGIKIFLFGDEAES